jgi:type VI secretion system protein ImpK
MDEAVKTATLTELATEIFLFALGMRERARLAQFGSVNQGALKLFDEFESRAKAARVDPDDITAVKFALAAFVDEIVLSAEWPGTDQWAEDPLQLHYFGTYLAGEGFFEKLDALKSQVKTRSEALGIYYQCLLLGFKGKYGVAGGEKLDPLKKIIQHELERQQAQDLNDLSPHWQATDKPLPRTDKLPRWFLYACVVVVAACVLLYAVFFFSLRNKVGSRQQSQTATRFTQSERSAGGAVQ